MLINSILTSIMKVTAIEHKHSVRMLRGLLSSDRDQLYSDDIQGNDETDTGGFGGTYDLFGSGPTHRITETEIQQLQN